MLRLILRIGKYAVAGYLALIGIAIIIIAIGAIVRAVR